jgi:hypothetical protein
MLGLKINSKRLIVKLFPHRPQREISHFTTADKNTNQRVTPLTLVKSLIVVPAPPEWHRTMVESRLLHSAGRTKVVLKAVTVLSVGFWPEERRRKN